MHNATIILACVFIIILRRYSRCQIRTDKELDSTPLSKPSDTDLHLAVVLGCAGFIAGMLSLRKSCDGNVWKAVTCLVRKSEGGGEGYKSENNKNYHCRTLEMNETLTLRTTKAQASLHIRAV